MSYIVLRVRWCNIIVLNAHSATEEKNNDSTDSFCEELEQLFDRLPMFYVKFILGKFNGKLGREEKFATRSYIKIVVIMMLQQ